MTPPYSSTDLLAIIAAIGGLVTTIVNAIIALRNSRKLDANTKVTEEVNAKADVIATSVNGAATAASQKIEELQREAEVLRTLLSEHKQTAAVLAAAVAKAERPRRATDSLRAGTEPLKVEVVNTPLPTVSKPTDQR